jgi:flagellar motor protein MotB
MRIFHSSRREYEATWLSFTDLLSNSLIILSLILVFSTISRILNEKPPVIQLPDNDKFRFSSGGYMLSANFLTALESEKIPVIKKTLACYGVDTLEIIGHTDGQPNSSASNLDTAFLTGKDGLMLSPSVRAGSNVDLGLLRAISVQRAIEQRLKLDVNDVIYRVYSAGSVINTDGRMEAVRNKDQRERRRIEIRFTRSRQTTFPKSC